MTREKPNLAQALEADRIAYERERTRAEAALPGLGDLSPRLRHSLGLRTVRAAPPN